LAGGRVIGKISTREIVIEPKGLFEGESKIKRNTSPEKEEEIPFDERS